jgi:DDE superfamily endonuclease
MNFVAETAHLRPRQTDIRLLVMDAFSGHVQYRALKRLRDAQVHVVELPAHTSHHTQPLDASIFGPMKNAFRVSSPAVPLQQRRERPE